ncbi:MAG TPA: response regulator transcription factor [Verrucomicrobiae bacterium]|nr:response regulator transcription factor [Verrucomicrobiae bacterium]
MKNVRKTQPEAADDKQRVLLVDDHPLVCEGLARRINEEPDLQVCGQARDAHSALEAIEKLQPHVAVVDIALGSGSGVELIKDIKVRHPHLPALVLSMHDEALYAERSLHAGAKGYIMKQEEPAAVLRAIRQVLRGQVYLSDRVKDGIVNRLGGNLPEGEVSSLTQQLSDRELEVFQLIGDGYSTHEIADRLHLSMKTVASHRENIKRKLNLNTSEELVRFAIHWLRYRNSNAQVLDAAATVKPAQSKR